jgi:ABC-type Fe3+-hydroxamate transport system substrate-binding protein
MENFTRTLDAQGIAYFVTNPNSLDDIYKSIYQIGEIFRREENGVSSSGRTEKARRRNRSAHRYRARDVKVFVQIDKNSLYTVGRESFITDLINRRAGGESLTEGIATAYPKISKETLWRESRTIILSESDNTGAERSFRNSPAVQKRQGFSRRSGFAVASGSANR